MSGLSQLIGVMLHVACGTTVSLEFYNIVVHEHACKELRIIHSFSVHFIYILCHYFDTQRCFFSFCLLVYKFLFPMFWACFTFSCEAIVSATFFAFLTIHWTSEFGFFMWFPTVPAVHCAALSLASCSLDSNEPVLRWLCWSPGRTLLPCKAVCMCQVSSFSPAVVSPSCWHYESHMLSESLNVQKLQNLSATSQWHRCW